MKFNFINKSGIQLSGRLEMPKNKPKAFALFAHCFTCSKDIIAAGTIAKNLTNHDIAVLRFDFTGLGNSDGDFSNTNFSSNVDDLLSACATLEEQYQAPQIMIGHSLGGAAVLKAAPQIESIRAVVTIGAPSEVSHVTELFKNEIPEINDKGEAQVQLAGRPFRIKKQFIDDINDTDILDGIKNMKKALLVMHSPIDNTVSVDHAGEIFLAARHPKSFISLDNADHLLMNRNDAAYAAQIIGAWVDRYIENDLNQEALKVGKGEVIVKNRRGHKFTQDIYTTSNHIVADEPISIKGDDLGMTPYDLLLAGLGACTSMTMRMYADHKGIPLEAVEVKLLHKKIYAEDCSDCETETGKVDEIVKEICIEGAMSEKQRKKLFEIAEKCPVNRTLQSEIKIRSNHN